MSGILKEKLMLDGRSLVKAYERSEGTCPHTSALPPKKFVKYFFRRSNHVDRVPLSTSVTDRRIELRSQRPCNAERRTVKIATKIRNRTKVFWSIKAYQNVTRSSAIAGRPCDAKACQGLLKWTWE